MLRLLLLLLSFWVATGWLGNSVAAQHFRCGTPPLSEAQRRFLLQTVVPAEKLAARGSTSLITYVPIKLHLFHRDDGSGGLTAAQIVKVMAECNEAYQPAGIQFYFCGTANHINDSRYFDDFNPAIESQICPANDVPNVLNLYMVNSCRLGTFIAGGYSEGARLVITYASGTSSGAYKHEFGHTFYLAHTQNGSNDPDISRRELVRRTNCATTGDLICDTPSDPYDRPGATSSNCAYTGIIADANGDRYTPDMANVMSYWCFSPGHFSAGQQSRMAAARLASYTSLSCGATNGPGAPTHLVATPGANTVPLSWTASIGSVMGYYVERAASLTDDFVTIGGTDPSITTFTDTRPPGVTTLYRVKPANAESSFSNVASASLQPLILASASGIHQEAEAYLNWATAAERDNAYFDVEVRPKGRAAFQSLGRVSNPVSITNAQRLYELHDPQLLFYLADTVFYRLTGVSQRGTRTPLTTLSVVVQKVAIHNPSGVHRDAESWLIWSTTSGQEYGNAYFDVEVRPKGRAAFQPLSRVSNPVSITNAQRLYELRDPQLLFYLADTVFYRLTGVNLGGARTSATTLPVAVQTIAVRDLRAVKQDFDGLLSWTTTIGQEYGNAYFDVEVRPTNSSIFKPLARLVTKPNTTLGSQQPYELHDPSLLMYRADSVHYRLWGVTPAKRTLLAQTVVSTAFPRIFSLQVHPNPFHDAPEAWVLISKAGPGEMTLHNALGQIVWRQANGLLIGLNVFKIEALASLPQGLYFLSVRQQESVRTVKVCKD